MSHHDCNWIVPTTDYEFTATYNQYVQLVVVGAKKYQSIFGEHTTGSFVDINYIDYLSMPASTIRERGFARYLRVNFVASRSNFSSYFENLEIKIPLSGFGLKLTVYIQPARKQS